MKPKTHLCRTEHVTRALATLHLARHLTTASHLITTSAKQGIVHRPFSRASNRHISQTIDQSRCEVGRAVGRRAMPPRPVPPLAASRLSSSSTAHLRRRRLPRAVMMMAVLPSPAPRLNPRVEHERLARGSHRRVGARAEGQSLRSPLRSLLGRLAVVARVVVARVVPVVSMLTSSNDHLASTGTVRGRRMMPPAPPVVAVWAGIAARAICRRASCVCAAAVVVMVAMVAMPVAALTALRAPIR